MLSTQPLAGRHDRRAFEASAHVDARLRQTAHQYQRRGISKTFVATAEEAPSRILGFYALTVCEIVADELPEDLGKQVPRRVPESGLAGWPWIAPSRVKAWASYC